MINKPVRAGRAPLNMSVCGRLAAVCGLLLLIFDGYICHQHIENVALNKNCTMNSNWNWNTHPARLAVNGDTGGDYFAHNCIHTRDNVTTQFWEVDLGRPYPVYGITVWARTGFIERMADCEITVDGKPCHKFPSSVDSSGSRNISVDCESLTLSGQVIRVSKKSSPPINSGDDTINMCEFQLWSCSTDYWGFKCNNTCGKCRDGAACDKVTGVCDTGCPVGFQPPLCAEECANGTYGQNCSQNCSTNCDDVCDKVNGSCTCQPGWIPPLCKQVCMNGTFGQDCAENCSQNCVEGVCDVTNGHCECEPGWRPPNCTETCMNGTFGQDCAENCSQNCVGVCDVTNGRCKCEPGWRLPNCTETCINGTFGQDCAENCSQNCVGGVCNVTNGHCDCETGWTPPTCTEVSEQKENSAPAAAIVGSVIPVVIVGVGAALAFFIVRKRRLGQKKADSTLREPATADPRDVTGFHNQAFHSTPPTQRAEHVGKKQDEKPAMLVKPLPKQTHLTSQAKKSPPSATDTSAVYVNVPLTQGQQSRTGNESEFSPVPDESLGRETGGEGIQPSAREFWREAGVQWDCLNQVLDKLCKDGESAREFQAMPRGLKSGCDIGTAEENQEKNRFQAIVPYDATRVVLRGDTEANGSDYINASYIKGCDNDKEYIAAQGPRKNTVGDFWKMVWQDHVTHIVMLTHLVEGNKKKCEKYWPQVGKRKCHGCLEIVGVEAQEKADYIVRTFTLKSDRSDTTRHVSQYHYTTWPDHHVPAATALVDFWRTVTTSHRSHQVDARSPSPLLVHCSAGVGRTGTFIGLDIAVRKALREQEVDIKEIVLRMRDDRCTMVQTQDQYTFLHEAVLEAYASHDTRLTLEEIASTDPVSEQRTEQEFKTLQTVTKFFQKPSYNHATAEENRGKNRNPDVLPDDNCMLYLSRHVRGRNQYINAVILPSFSDPCAFILTQLPLPDTVVDFWRLVDGNDVTTVVSLGSEMDEFENNGRYWRKELGEPLTACPYTITTKSADCLGPSLLNYTLTVQHEEEQRRVQLLHYTDWKGEVPGNTPDLIQLVDLLSAARDKRAPVLIQCLDGASKSGLFSAICDVISRMTSEREVDAYLTSRHVKTVRPQSVTSVEQYRYLYQILKDYRRSNNVYVNTIVN